VDWAGSVVQVGRVHHWGWLYYEGRKAAGVKKAITIMGIR